MITHFGQARHGCEGTRLYLGTVIDSLSIH